MDCRGFTFDINLEGYQNAIISNIENANCSKLDLIRKSYKEKFNAKLNEMIDIINFDKTID